MQNWGGVNSLIIKHLSFRFAGRKQLLQDVSLEINRGEIVALLGEVGSGKSILLQILQKFQKYEEGKIEVNGSILFEEIDTQEWRSMVGVVPQEVKIFNGTLIENIVLDNVLEKADEAVEFCKEWGFDQYFEHFPQGYLTIVGEEGVNLSGGQKQLVALARALVRKPSLLLLDEATSAMDAKTEQFVFGLLQKLRPEMAVLMVTHKLSLTKEINGVYELKNGVTKCIKVIV